MAAWWNNVAGDGAHCPAGRWSIEAVRCSDCLSGQYAAAKTDACEGCPPGKWSTAAATACQICPSGRSSPPVSGLCAVCPAGQLSTTGGPCTLCTGQEPWAAKDSSVSKRVDALSFHERVRHLKWSGMTPLWELDHKGWSGGNKFVVNFAGRQAFLKLGDLGIDMEFAYHSIAQALRFNITLPTLFDQGALMTPFVPHMEHCGNDHCKQLCLAPANVRGAQIAVVDFLVGYVDRPVNCHTISGVAYAVDNDSGTTDCYEPNTTMRSYQWVQLQRMGPAAVAACKHISLPQHLDVQEVLARGINAEFITARFEHIKALCDSSRTHQKPNKKQSKKQNNKKV